MSSYIHVYFMYITKKYLKTRVFAEKSRSHEFLGRMVDHSRFASVGSVQRTNTWNIFFCLKKMLFCMHKRIRNNNTHFGKWQLSGGMYAFGSVRTCHRNSVCATVCCDMWTFLTTTTLHERERGDVDESIRIQTIT